MTGLARLDVEAKIQSARNGLGKARQCALLSSSSLRGRSRGYRSGLAHQGAVHILGSITAKWLIYQSVAIAAPLRISARRRLVPPVVPDGSSVGKKNSAAAISRDRVNGSCRYFLIRKQAR